MKIAILGAASTGKTWLSSALAQHFQSQVRHVEDATLVDVLIADTPPARWSGVCEKCSDPDCEFRLFTALQNSKAAVHPAS